jgi:hypothetical protein
METALGGHFAFRAHIDLAGGILADQHHGQSRLALVLAA